MNDRFDCVVCGELCVDLAIRPIDHKTPLAGRTLVAVDPIQPGGGGIVPNSGIAMSRLGLKTAAFGCVGRDAFGDFLEQLLTSERIDASCLTRHKDLPTSTTAILIGADGEHTFAYYNGASRAFTRDIILKRLDLFSRSKFALFGYYGLMPKLEEELPAVLQQVRARGCRTAMDAAGGGGRMQPLERILPYLDIYVPSREEAVAQTGLHEPREIVEAFRGLAPDALLGVKLGAEGALVSPAANQWIKVDAVEPLGPVIDTTGAGDCFYAGLIAGLARGWNVQDAAKLGAAAGACAVTKIGAVAGIRDLKTTVEIAGITH